MKFSWATRFGYLRFSGATPRPQVFFESLGQQMDKAFDTTGLNSNALTPLAEKVALSFHLARQEWHLVKAGLQRNVNYVTDLLPLREQDYMAQPGAHDTISRRQKRLASIAMLPGGASYFNITSVLQTILGSAFVGLRVVRPTEAVTNLPTSVFTNPQVEAKFLALNVPLAITSMGAVVGTGTTHPVITIAANGLAASNVVTSLQILVTTGGVLTVGSTNVLFRWYINGVSQGILTASTAGVVLPGIGTTVTFGVGTYTSGGGTPSDYTATITPQLIGYQNLDPTIPVVTPLAIGDVITVQGENMFTAETVTVTALIPTDGSALATPVYYGTTPVYRFFQATFGNPHDTGATVTTMPYPRWTSTQSFLYVEVTPSAAIDPTIRGQVDTAMEKLARGWCGWATVAATGGFIGPFQLGAAPPAAPGGTGLGSATIGSLAQ